MRASASTSRRRARQWSSCTTAAPRWSATDQPGNNSRAVQGAHREQLPRSPRHRGDPHRRSMRSRVGYVPTSAICTRGYVHGGVWVAFADTASRLGTYRHLPADHDFTTAELKANVFAAGHPGDVLHGIGQPFHVGRRTQVWQVRIRRNDESCNAASFQLHPAGAGLLLAGSGQRRRDSCWSASSCGLQQVVLSLSAFAVARDLRPPPSACWRAARSRLRLTSRRARTRAASSSASPAVRGLALPDQPAPRPPRASASARSAAPTAAPVGSARRAP